jgi:hypothetical protein
VQGCWGDGFRWEEVPFHAQPGAQQLLVTQLLKRAPPDHSTNNDNLSSNGHNVSHENTGPPENCPMMSCYGVAQISPIVSYLHLSLLAEIDVWMRRSSTSFFLFSLDASLCLLSLLCTLVGLSCHPLVTDKRAYFTFYFIIFVVVWNME